MTKQKFGIYGNCQSEVLAQTLLENPHFSDAWEEAPLPLVQRIGVEHVAAVPSVVAQLDLLIYQPFKSAALPSLSSDEVVKHLLPTSMAIGFPSLYFDGYFPQLASLTGVPSPLNRVHDYLAIDCFLRGGDVTDVVARLKDERLFKKAHAKRYFQGGIDELRKREKTHRLTATISDFVDAYARKYKLFFQFNHPVKSLYQHVARQILNRLGIHESADVDLSDIGPEPTVVCPPLRSIYYHNQCQFDCEFDTYKVADERLSMVDVIERMYISYLAADAEILRKHLKKKNLKWRR
ncbi:MAG: hypothetical protein JXR76_21035 [Deltaproteobacteria bacterium]|nr:hypothetical protein [Deltaproteobacteria bacterium]